ncbi:HCO3 transporter family-domain-containing protein [Durotheca rogersii]|uniref:HCO3 transporter family-domain-containing protein n=1 Tax=Durotheca rogersii TaxID=419775 RepID=UPI00221F6C09|nr:HCO3 transporter family-domain-containing protein [Durotheca rogersii]KAI5865473.1 HCO3 transporter family-domain-containing protein [Durotheca rogersii]
MSRTADSLALPTAAMHADPAAGLRPSAEEGGGRMRRWVSSLASSSRRAAHRHPHHHRQQQQQQQQQHRRLEESAPGRHADAGDSWWRIHLFRGMVNDVRRRAPFYASDWLDAWDYRVVPSTVYMYFAKCRQRLAWLNGGNARHGHKLTPMTRSRGRGTRDANETAVSLLCSMLPALAFSLDMFTKTNMQYGVNEVLLSSVLGAVVFALLACQPLVIVGVTGPITVFNYTVYDIMAPTGIDYLAFMCWIGLWSLVFHWILAATNACNWLRYVTRFPCDIFGFYVAFIYLQKGVQVLERLTSAGGEGGDGDGDGAFYLSIAVALLVFMAAYACGELGAGPLFRHPVRVFLQDYGTPLAVVFFTGFVRFGRMRAVALEPLPTGSAFAPTAARPWLVRFWDIPVRDVFLALPFAVLLTILFYFDHNVSSLIAQGTEFPLRKPAGFHWDIFLLGLTTGAAGVLGLPFPNGLIPQAPFHTESLCVTRVEPDTEEDGAAAAAKGHYVVRRTHVVEQRASNLAQGLLTLGTMTGPLLGVLHLIPQAVLAGLFFIIGYQAVAGNGITAKLAFLARDAALTPGAHPLKRLPRRAAVWGFVAVELAAFAATFAITQTVAAVGFPVAILALVPARALLLPRLFTPAELAALDAPAASPFTMESVGGTSGIFGAAAELAAATETASAAAPVAGGSGAGGGDGDGKKRKSEEVLAEEGRGRPSADVEAGEAIEMGRLGISRRGQASRSVGLEDR